MRNYELLFVLNPSLNEEQRAEMIEKIKSIIEAGGKVENVDEWGEKKLAYPIEKNVTGYYVVVTFQAEKDLPKELDRRIRISDNIMRHIIVCPEED